MPLNLVWSPLARRRLLEIHDFVARDKPDAAARLATRIVAITQTLREHPHLGRTGHEPGIRELVVGGTPYVVLYRIRQQRVVITTIWHGSQQYRP